jgi:hypothetical protein
MQVTGTQCQLDGHSHQAPSQATDPIGVLLLCVCMCVSANPHHALSACVLALPRPLQYTMGGVEIDAQARALRPSSQPGEGEGTPVPGLYAAGEVSGG